MKHWLVIASVNGALAVAFGAVAAHALAGRLDPEARQIFETGARYHMYHALALGLSALAMRDGAVAAATWAARLFLAGIVLFSGSLYLLALSDERSLAMVTPFGGILFIAGWLTLALAATRLGR